MANENNKFLSFSGLETLVDQIYNIFLTKSNAISTYVTKRDFDQFKQNIDDVVNVDTSNLATKQELNNVTTQVNKNKSDIGNCLTKVDAEKTYAKNPITPEDIGAAPKSHNHDNNYAKKSHTHNYADLKNGVYSAVIEEPDTIFDYITLERPMYRLFIPTEHGVELLARCIEMLMQYAPDDTHIYINSVWDPALSDCFYNQDPGGVVSILESKMVRGFGVFFNIHTIEYQGIINAFIDIEIY